MSQAELEIDAAGEANIYNEKGMTSIPKTVREAMEIKPGDKLILTVQDGVMTARKKNR